MLVAFAFYTTLVICLNVIVMGGGSNLFPPEDLPTFTQDDIEEKILGSKIVIVSEQAMLNTIFLIKAAMLIMYLRLTSGLHQRKIVKGIAIYTACGWVGTELAFFFVCRPFSDYWAVPPHDPQCTTFEYYAITQACFNISSDLLMLGIMLPLLLQVNLPVKQKLALIGLFSMGFFVILAAILTKYFNLIDVYSTVYMLWYVRESSTAMYVANLPMIWPMLREWFPYLRKITPGHRSTNDTNRRTGGTNGNSMLRKSILNEKGSIPMSHVSKSKSNSQYTTMGTETDIERTGSAEQINRPPFDGPGIFTETTVEIDIDEGARSSIDDVEMGKAHNHHADTRTPYEWEKSPTITIHDRTRM